MKDQVILDIQELRKVELGSEKKVHLPLNGGIRATAPSSSKRCALDT